MFVVCATFRVNSDGLDLFLPSVKANAAASLANEPGCHRFDVCQSRDDPAEVFLYEIYESAEAFEAHKQSEHYAVFSDQVGSLIADKSVKTMDLLS